MQLLDRPAERGVAELDHRAAGHEGTVGRGPVLGEEVHAQRSHEPLDHADDVAPAPAERVAHPVDHHEQRHVDRVAQLDERAGQPGQPGGLGSAHRHDEVGRGHRVEGELVAGEVAPRVTPELGGVLEAEAGVDHDVAHLGRAREHRVEHALARLDPPVRARQSGEHLESGRHHAPAPGERLGVEGAGVDQAGRGQQPAHLVEHAEVLGHGAAVGVGVDEHARSSGVGVGGGEGDGQRRTARGAGRPVHGDHPPGTRGGLQAGLPGRVRVDDEVLRAGSAHRLGERVHLVGGQHRHGAEPGEQVGVSPDGHAPDVLAQQPEHGVGVEAAELTADDGDRCLPGGRTGEQVRQVDAALEHHHPGAGQGPQRLGLPGLAAGRQQDRQLVGHDSWGGHRSGSAVPGDDDVAVGDAAQRRAEGGGARLGHAHDHLAGGLRRELVGSARDGDDHHVVEHLGRGGLARPRPHSPWA